MIARYLNDDRGSPSAEFALMLPALIVLLFGGFEAGNFMWTQHKLVTAVREGARYASRLPIENFCNGTAENLDTTAETAIKTLTVTGLLPDAQGSPQARARVQGWTINDVIVQPDCDGFAATGIYTQLGHAGPTVRVSTGSVAYPSLLNGLGVLDNAIRLAARSDSAVIGI